MTEQFPADWLELREPVDHRSRAHGLVDALTMWWRARRPAAGNSDPSPMQVVDLAAGAGSNLRYLSRRLPSGQSWTLIDHDSDLLERAEAGSAGAGDVACVLRSLDVSGPDAIADVIAPAAGGRADLVTASALFDLVSRAWVRDLTAAMADSGAAALFTLSYDGSIVWSESDPDDALVRDAVNDHQAGDKGFGPALGPQAGATIVESFQKAGYRVRADSSPWQLDSADAALVHQLVDGWANAAIERRPDARERITRWRQHRKMTFPTGEGTLEVGHLDVLALPPV